MRVRLTADEIEYLRNGGFLDEAAKMALMRGTFSGEEYLAELSPDDADAIRDACGEQLQRVGFDQDYKPTKEGATLEGLIDKLLIR